MPVVSNTSPILNLAIIDQLELLQQQFGQIHIPPAVLKELKIDQDLPGSSRIRDAITAGWIQVHDINNRSIANLLKQTLDQGESEAIALALELPADWILLDERDARQVAKSLGLRITGVLGILIRAKDQGQILSLPTVLNQLKQEAGFWIAPELLARVIGKT
ncbi:DUF3368 domain-containing protein [Coleofasciculus sp. F4-SAH-05]|uniref:DUF3368 domain-containing protein n=1 Tax=Coleofasciculus sp. F4-SAH-05 TaxID=3069525 RepID=UPI0032F5868A